MAQPHSHHHAHGHHAHGHHAPRRPPAVDAAPAWSLLRASLAQRLVGVAALLAGLWALVGWALRT